MVRLFAALDPPPAVVEALGRAVGDPDPRLRWSPPEQWHVTLAFYGSVPERSVTELAQRLGRAAARTAPLPLVVRGFGAFPSPGRGRVLYAGLAGDVAGLSRLADRCVAAGRRSGVEMERRRFRPHLTVARSRQLPVDVHDLIREYDDIGWRAEAMRLVRSTLGAAVHHETLHEWPLTAHQA